MPSCQHQSHVQIDSPPPPILCIFKVSVLFWFLLLNFTLTHIHTLEENRAQVFKYNDSFHLWSASLSRCEKTHLSSVQCKRDFEEGCFKRSRLIAVNTKTLTVRNTTAFVISARARLPQLQLFLITLSCQWLFDAQSAFDTITGSE